MKSKNLANKIDELLALLGEVKLVSMLKFAEMPDHLMPNSDQRKPFSLLSDEAILQFLLHSRVYPWGLGQLTQTLYQALNLSRSCPTEFVILESHIDVSAITREDEDIFISMGFEPDHFETLNPPEYNLCYTLRWEIPKNEWGKINHRKVKQYVIEATKKACKIIEKQNYPAYAEVEIYSHAGKKKFEDFDLTKGEIGNFPYKSNDFIELINSEKNVFKKADIHVKVPNGNEFLNNTNVQQKIDALTLMFTEAGFYEIISKSGNKIFTVQCIFPNDAVNIFNELVIWAEKSHLVRSINHETCLFFWKHQWRENDEYFTSPIPKIVKRNSQDSLENSPNIWAKMGVHDQAETYKVKALELFEQMEVPKQIERVNQAFEQGAQQ